MGGVADQILALLRTQRSIGLGAWPETSLEPGGHDCLHGGTGATACLRWRRRSAAGRAAASRRVAFALPPAEAGPQGRRLCPPPGGRRLQVGRHVSPNGLRLLGPRVCGLPLDRVEAPALELGSAARGPAGSLRAAPPGRPALHRRWRPRSACGLEERCGLGTANGRARPLRPLEAAPAGVRRRAEGAQVVRA